MNRKIRYTSFLIILLFTNTTILAQRSGPASYDLILQDVYRSVQPQRTALDSLVTWREQVWIHLDKDVVSAKGHLFFKAYVLTGPRQLRWSANDVMRVELLDDEGNLIKGQYHKIERGMANGTITLPKKLATGKYYLRAYTRWMLNYGEESLPIKEVIVSDTKLKEEDINQMFTIIPEGGHFVAGLENKGIISNSVGGNIEGRIVNSEGSTVARVVNYGHGLATFSFVPMAEERYYLEKPNLEKMELANIGNEGATLQVNNVDEGNIKVRIGVTETLKNTNYYLKGMKHGREYLKSEVKLEKGVPFVELDILKKELPHGLFNLTLVDAFDQVWAERPVYIKPSDLQFSLTNETIENGGGDQRVRYYVKVTDAQGNPVATELSLSVQGAKINSGLPLHSTHERSLNFLTDLKVLAKRPIDGSPVMDASKMPEEIRYDFQNGLEFYGQAYDFNNTLLSNKDIQIFINNKDEVEVKEVTTNENGLFAMTGLQFDGKVTLTFRREGKDTMEKLVKVIPYEYELPKLRVSGNTAPAPQRPKRVEKSGQFIPSKRLSDFSFKDKPANLIPLEEVTLVGRRQLGKTSRSVYNITPTRVVYQDDAKPKTIPQLFLGIPGVYVTHLGDIARVSVSLPKRYGQGPVLYVVDGIPLAQPDAGSLSLGVSPLADAMSLVNFLDVERIELLAGPDAGIYGSRAAGGVILIYTKSGAYSLEYIARKDAQYQYQGFQEPLDFNTYLTSKDRRRIKDGNLNTLYWNPSLKTDQNGEAILEFTLPDTPRNLVLDAKAITEDGKSGSLKMTLNP